MKTITQKACFRVTQKIIQKIRNETQCQRFSVAYFTIFLCAFLCSCVGCETMPGGVSASKSLLDDERQVTVEPGFFKGAGMMANPIKLGGFWTTKSPDRFNLEIVIRDTDQIEMLKVGIDGEITELKSDQITGHRYVSAGGYSESFKTFNVPIEFIEQILAAKKVIFQIVLSRSFSEGVFSTDVPGSARPGLRKAIVKIAQLKNQTNP